MDEIDLDLYVNLEEFLLELDRLSENLTSQKQVRRFEQWPVIVRVELG